ncbi:MULTISPECIES: hypothetical protein [Amycolatopsis]|uniref:RNA-binding protein associated with RNAse of E/G family n=1 Tax=Amycolatopsis roodepoortensis TaxID=700274 RepID=A0ABR9L2R0_9PSEU|nr:MULTISPECIES: hypothetical protein [Amycolatopsis]MBE1575049.1 putative RNA-binding protein associated with RNAse of E/G family [Amycolatopsis roodepoortensis]GHG97292.1 hypothetical protein GCM10017788_76700 [Amycolatopsis acidiphila]
MTELDALADATRHYHQTKDDHDKAQEAVAAATVAALKAGHRPTDVVEHSPFTAAYVRRLAREAGIAPARPGPKPTKET